MNGYAPINTYRGLWRYNGMVWEPVTYRPGHRVELVLPEFLNTYNAYAEYPELSGSGIYFAGLWYFQNGWKLHRYWQTY